jgi:hypothetical protein
MEMITYRIGLLILLSVILLSCDLNGNDPDVCNYNVSIEYRYNRNSSYPENEMPFYINILEEYIFDESGMLIYIDSLDGKSCQGNYISELSLPVGKYSLVTWGNQVDSVSRVYPDPDVDESTSLRTVSSVLDQINRNNMELAINNPIVDPRPAPMQMSNNSERLYYSYRTFSVNPIGISRIEVDMTHAHCVLDITVEWKRTNEQPPNTNDFLMILKNIPSQYEFMPEFLVRRQWWGEDYTPEGDLYPSMDVGNRINYIPEIEQNKYVSHMTNGRMSNGKLYGRFITYRYRNSSHEVLSIYAGEKQIMKEIDLYEFFHTVGINLDLSLCQEYSLLLVIDGDKVTVSMINIEDWEDGGNIG